MDEFEVEVIEKVWETPTVFLLRLRRTDGEPLDFLPGQWVLVRLEGGADLRRAYSVASPPHEIEHFELCVKALEGGSVSPLLAKMEKGETFDCAGPFGKFKLVDPLVSDVKFVATGTGVAPFKSMIDTLLHNGTSVDVLLLYGARQEDEIIYGKHFRHLAEKHENLMYVPTLSRPPDGWTGHRGYVQTLVEKYVQRYEDEEIYLCGVPEMVNEVKGMFLKMGAPRERVHTEKWY